MAKQHSPQFLKLSLDAKSKVRECTIADVKARLDQGESFHLIDVREESEWAAGRIPGAMHLGKGIIERDIEEAVPDTSAPIVLYSGGGFRSAMAAVSLGQMGYENVISMDGGMRGWREAEYAVETD